VWVSPYPRVIASLVVEEGEEQREEEARQGKRGAAEGEGGRLRRTYLKETTRRRRVGSSVETRRDGKGRSD